MRDPMNMAESYTYDIRGNVITKTDRNGTKFSYEYDALNRLTKESAKVGNTDVVKSTTSYSFNEDGNVVKTESNGKDTIASRDNGGDKYWFSNVNSSSKTYNKNLSSLTLEERNYVEFINDEKTTALIHTHWYQYGNLKFSQVDNTEMIKSYMSFDMKYTYYLVNRNREVYSATLDSSLEYDIKAPEAVYKFKI